MKWHRKRTECIVRPEDIVPDKGMKVIGTFNPGATLHNGRVVLMIRVAEEPIAQREGFTGLPRWDINRQQLEIDWVRNEELNFIDIRVVDFKTTGLRRLTSWSYLLCVQIDDPFNITKEQLNSGIKFLPNHYSEMYGIEDPRITKIEDRYYFTYVAVSQHGVCTSLASTEDFKSFDRYGIILPCENKDVVLFPKKINGKYHMLHRPNPNQPFRKPEMWIASSDDLISWGNHAPLLAKQKLMGWMGSKMGASVPPVFTEMGWLEIFHGNNKKDNSYSWDVGSYFAGVMYLDINDPSIVLDYVSNPVLSPELNFEREGFVPNVIFPTGIVEQDDEYLLYYGACDTYVGVTSLEK